MSVSFGCREAAVSLTNSREAETLSMRKKERLKFEATKMVCLRRMYRLTRVD